MAFSTFFPLTLICVCCNSLPKTDASIPCIPDNLKFGFSKVYDKIDFPHWQNLPINLAIFPLQQKKTQTESVPNYF